jgi:hypothetical protein
MTLIPDELQVLMHSFDPQLIARLTTFYDVSHPYTEQKRVSLDERIRIDRPQLSLLGGTTPAHLFSFIPEEAWSMGFTSRLILVYSAEVMKKKVRFNDVHLRKPDDLVHDLSIINQLQGEFTVDEQAQKAFENWIELGEQPVPGHKRLEHYLGRRYPHLLKLCMVSAVDRGNALVITVDDFNRALGWLIEVEHAMPGVFQAGPQSVDSKIMEEVHFFLKSHDLAQQGMAESRLKNFVLQRVSALQYNYFWPLLETGGYIKRIRFDKTTKEVYWTWCER